MNPNNNTLLEDRGWIGFGRNYFHSLGSEESNVFPLECHQEEPYSWGIESQNPSQQDTVDDPTKNSPPTTNSIANIPLIAHRYCHEIPNKPKQRKNQNQAQGEDQIAPAACSSAASFFLSGSRHNRITTLGTIHGRVYSPALEKSQGNSSSKGWDPSLLSPSTVTIPLPLPCVELAAGRHFCLARLQGGLAVCSWGAGHFGQLGHGASFSADASSDDGTSTSTFQATPRVIERLLPRMVGSPIVQIAAGDWHGMALSQEGTVLAWGCNRNMQCGRKSTRNINNAGAASSTSAPLQMIPMPVIILDTDPDRADDPPIAIAKIVCGKAHSVAISKQQRVYCWGASHYGQCASNTGSSVRTTKYTRSTMALPRLVQSLQDVTVVDVAAGDRHTLALTQGGRVFSWGAGAEGQLGIFPPIVCTPKPRLINDLDFVAIAAADMQPQRAGIATAAMLSQPPPQQQQQQQGVHELASVPTIISVHAAGCSSLALSSSGHVYVWGSNDAGSLGLPIPHASRLPYWEVGVTLPPPPDERLLQVRTFDSQHNVLLPKRIDSIAGIYVEQITLGPSHSWFLGEIRQEGNETKVGLTLFEVQQLRKKNGLGIGGAGLGTTTSASSVSGSIPPSSAGSDPGIMSQTNERTVVSPASTMPTDDEDDVTTDSMSASVPGLTNAVGRRGLPSSALPLLPLANSTSATGTRAGRRFSDTAITQTKGRQFSLSNLLRRLGSSTRRNSAFATREETGGTTSNISNHEQDKSESGGKGRFRLRSNAN